MEALASQNEDSRRRDPCIDHDRLCDLDCSIDFEEEEEEEDDDDARTSNELKVHFGTVEIREYPILLGDNPSVMRGAPLTMDWNAVQRHMLPVDDFEDSIKQHRSLQQIIRSPQQRFDLLLDLDYARGEILQGQRLATIGRNQRRQTNQVRNYDFIHERLELISRTLQRWFGLRPSKRSERAYLDLHCGGSSSYHSRGPLKQYLDGSTSSTKMGVPLVRRRKEGSKTTSARRRSSSRPHDEDTGTMKMMLRQTEHDDDDDEDLSETHVSSSHYENSNSARSSAGALPVVVGSGTPPRPPPAVIHEGCDDLQEIVASVPSHRPSITA